MVGRRWSGVYWSCVALYMPGQRSANPPGDTGPLHGGGEAWRHDDPSIPGMGQAFLCSHRYPWPIPGMLERLQREVRLVPPAVLHVVALAGILPEITALFPEPNTDFLEYTG